MGGDQANWKSAIAVAEHNANLEVLHDLLVIWKSWRDRPVVPNVVEDAVHLALAALAESRAIPQKDPIAPRGFAKGDIVLFQGKLGQIDAISVEPAALLNLYQNSVRVLAPLSECAIERRAGH